MQKLYFSGGEKTDFETPHFKPSADLKDLIFHFLQAFNYKK